MDGKGEKHVTTKADARVVARAAVPDALTRQAHPTHPVVSRCVQGCGLCASCRLGAAFLVSRRGLSLLSRFLAWGRPRVGERIGLATSAFGARRFSGTLVGVGKSCQQGATRCRDERQERAMLADASASTGAIICAPLISAAPSSAEAGAGASSVSGRAGKCPSMRRSRSINLRWQNSLRPACRGAW